MIRRSAILTMVASILLVTACSDDPRQPKVVADNKLEISKVDSPPPAFLSKDMSWMPKDIWLPADFEPTQSQKMNPMAETYLLRGNTQTSAADLLAAYNDRMIAAGYDLFPVEDPKPGMILFRGNGHGMVIIDVKDEGVKRVLVVSVENATGD